MIMNNKRNNKKFYWSVYGRTICNPRLPQNINSILFVCKGNICRSPFAEYYASKYLNTSIKLFITQLEFKVNFQRLLPQKQSLQQKFWSRFAGSSVTKN